MNFRFFIFTLISFVLIILSACGPSQQQLAAGKLNMANALLSSGDTVNSLLNLDSIPRLFPEASAEKEKAKEIRNRIYGARLTRQRENLVASQKIITSLISGFKAEKGEFDRYTSYVHNRQAIDQNWTRSFVQVYFNEKGDLTLLSNYYGEQWLNHTSFRIVGEGFSAKSDSVALDQPNNHHGDFNGAMWERITYNGPQAEEIISLIAANGGKKIKAVYRGTTTNTFWIEDFDKKAIKDAFELSKAFKIKSEAERLIPELEKKIR
jgi:hypothetical protein